MILESYTGLLHIYKFTYFNFVGHIYFGQSFSYHIRHLKVTLGDRNHDLLTLNIATPLRFYHFYYLIDPKLCKHGYQTMSG
jgi:hypothetical protein